MRQVSNYKMRQFDYKYDSYYKLRQLYYKMRKLYKMLHLLQIATVQLLMPILLSGQTHEESSITACQKDKSFF